MSQPIDDVSDADVIAVVFGNKITVRDGSRLDALISGVLFDQYVKDNKLEPTEDELNIFIFKFEEKEKQHQVELEQDRRTLLKELKNPSLGDRERKEKESRLQTIELMMEVHSKGTEQEGRTMIRQLARRAVGEWKMNKSLYKKYGGRVIFQQAGPEPIDAYRDFLKEQEQKGAFQILNKKYEASFWYYFINDHIHTFIPKDDGADAINTPWWLMEDLPRK